MKKTNTETKTSKAYSRGRVSEAKVAYWGLAWLLATAGATFGPELLGLWNFDYLHRNCNTTGTRLWDDLGFQRGFTGDG